MKKLTIAEAMVSFFIRLHANDQLSCLFRLIGSTVYATGIRTRIAGLSTM